METLTLNNRTDLSLTGIKKVKNAEPNIVTALVGDGAIIISGQNLSVQQLDIKEGNLVIAGKVTSMKYTNQVSKNFSIRNIFR